MKKKIFALTAVSVVCACGLVIDPDKLVEGNASGGPSNPDAADVSNTDDGDVTPIDAATDTGDDSGIVVVIPECVPAKPAAALSGPFAVVSAPASGPAPVCPQGYLPTPLEQGKGGFSAAPAVCTDATGCSCTSSGATTCGLRVRNYNDSNCTKEADQPQTATTACGDLDSEQFYKLEHIVGGVSCNPSGGAATPTSKPAPVFQTQYIVCAPDPAVPTAQCSGGSVPLPPASAASACVIMPANQSCAGTAYAGTISLSKNGAFTDGRACACGCQTTTACIGGEVGIYDSLSCGGSPTTLTIGACVERDSQDSYKQTTAPAPGASPCSARATPTGEATPTNDLKICCVATGGN